MGKDSFSARLGTSDPKKLKGDWNKYLKVAEFKLSAKGVNWRVYHEKFENGERVLLRMHLKTPGKQNDAIDVFKKRKTLEHWKVKKRNDDCDKQ